ncbi:MAG TPA: hypothetical protein PLI09_27400 [Candidatus Hydrogenedentes bacterium]|nr:hypothetical protein [Candidatus Hydrogenedentota bacterium]
MKNGMLVPTAGKTFRYMLPLLFMAIPTAWASPHSADYQEPEGIISLSELLRVIQLYNVGTFHCDAGTEDGYAPGTGDQSCTPHNSDYTPRDWSISLSELLRMIQFYNSGGYHLESGTEDGYGPGPGDLYEGEGGTEGMNEGAEEGEGTVEGTEEGSPGEGSPEEGEILEGESEGSVEGLMEGAPEGALEGTVEGSVEGINEGTLEGIEEGALEGSTEGIQEGVEEGLIEGSSEGSAEGFIEGEGVVEGSTEGVVEGEFEGAIEGEGVIEGSTEGDIEGEGSAEGEGTAEGSPEGTVEGEGEVEGVIEGEGSVEGYIEGAIEGEGVPEGSVEGSEEGEEPVYAIGYTTVTYQDPARGNRNVAVKIYYPATAAGQDTPVAGDAGTTFPVLIFGHGFLIGIDYYGYLWDALVPKGYIALLCNTETGVLPNHSNFGQDLAFLADRFQAEGADAGSRFYGKVANKTAVMGHSMGGGSTFLSVQYSANITTIVTFAAAETNPSAISAAAGITLPALVFSGTSDCVAPPDSHQTPMYNALPPLCKYHINITQGSHCQFAQNSTICQAGEIICFGATFVDDAVQKALTTEFTSIWLSAFLKNDVNAGAEFVNALDTETSAERIAYTGLCN